MKKNLFLKFLFRKIRKISIRKPNFFSEASSTNFFCFTLSLHCWYSIPSLVWFGQLLNPKKKPIFKIPFSRNSQKFRTKTQFFPGQLYQFFALHSHYTVDTQYRVWFDLDNSLTRWKKIKILKNSQFAKFAKFRMKTEFFPRHALPNFFALHSHYIGDTPYPVWFDLDNSLTRWKKNVFLKFLFREIPKVLYENPTFFLGKLNKKYFLLYTTITLVILHTPFGLIWTTPWPDAKKLFLKFSKIRNSRNSQNSVWKPNFFLGTLYQKLLLYTLITLVILHTAFGLIWTTP